MKREPLTVRMLASLAVAAVIDLVVVFGVDVPAGLEATVVGLAVTGALVYTVVSGRRKVTSLHDPRDDQGRVLVPRTQRVDPRH